ncbi:hypothetical protein GIS00_25070 [Nakamurella sp. YIM 132087]|uniref:Uncharacterized protein n=1 Tax=Nakamurella alba TaxID=2665158 RepID=A0A7K1FSS3_9ACTN|nr:hypothetical protein [Nakamurella alba]MTD17206.1 hypothetical protein [Nakamurella alba]
MSTPATPSNNPTPSSPEPAPPTRGTDFTTQPAAAEPAPGPKEHAETSAITPPAGPRYDIQDVVSRERAEFGGMKFGAAFFGWLAATGLAVIAIAILSGAGVAFGLTDPDTLQPAQNNSGTARTVGLVGAIVLLVIVLISYYCGGYVAGRMARFNGGKQGVAVWMWALVTTLLAGLIGWIAGSKFNVFADLNLPRIPIDEGTVTAAGLIAIGAAVLVALAGAVLGGIAGTRYHRRIDRAGFAEST